MKEPSWHFLDSFEITLRNRIEVFPLVKKKVRTIIEDLRFVDFMGAAVVEIVPTLIGFAVGCVVTTIQGSIMVDYTIDLVHCVFPIPFFTDVFSHVDGCRKINMIRSLPIIQESLKTEYYDRSELQYFLRFLDTSKSLALFTKVAGVILGELFLLAVLHKLVLERDTTLIIGC